MGYIPIPPAILYHRRDALYSGKGNGTITDTNYSSGIAGLGSGICIAIVIIISLGLFLLRKKLFAPCTLRSRTGTPPPHVRETLTAEELRSLDKKCATITVSRRTFLPKVNKGSYSSTSAGSGPKECSICTELYTDDATLRQLPCGHEFHRSCVDPWLSKQSGTCPLCRARVLARSSATRVQLPLSPRPIFFAQGRTNVSRTEADRVSRETVSLRSVPSIQTQGPGSSWQPRPLPRRATHELETVTEMGTAGDEAAMNAAGVAK